MILEVSIIKLIVGLFIIVHLLLIATVISMRVYKVLCKRWKRRIARHIRKVIAHVMVNADDMMVGGVMNSGLFLLQRHLSNRRSRRVLVAEIKHAALLVSGDRFMMLQKLYLELNLHESSYRRLKSGTIEQKIKAIIELSVLRYSMYNEEIKKYIKHPNDQLRVEAVLALVNMSRDPLFFLQDQEVTINEWETVRILKKLNTLNWKRLPDFTQWYNHRQPSIVVFALRMTAYYRHWIALPKVHDLTFSHVPIVREVALETLQLLSIKQDSSTVIPLSSTQPDLYAFG